MKPRNLADRPDDKKSCAVWTGTQWEIWPVSAIHPHRKTVIARCHECHGPVLLMNASKDGRNDAHFEHHPAHTGCSLAHRNFTGTKTQHPLAVSDPTKSERLAFTDYISDQAAEDIIGSVKETEKEGLLLARVGQGAFRKKLISRWGNCSVMGCGPETALVASHIVSWRACETNEERLDVNNGLLLSPNLDKLFDRRLISFSNNGALLVSPDLVPSDAVALGICAGMQPRLVPHGIVKYLARHRDGTEWCEPPIHTVTLVDLLLRS